MLRKAKRDMKPKWFDKEDERCDADGKWTENETQGMYHCYTR